VIGSAIRSLARLAGIQRRPSNRQMQIAGVEVQIPPMQGLGFELTEPWMEELLRKILPVQNGVFLDVGVNLGQTLVKVKAIDPNRRYLGFEPNPVCVHFVGDLVRLNRYSDVRVLPIGLSQEDTVLCLEKFSENPVDSSASIVPGFRTDRPVHSREFVPVFRFDSVARHLEGVAGVIKIDVEGAELEVFGTLSDLIRRDRPIVLIEVLPVYDASNTMRLERQRALENAAKEQCLAILRVSKSATVAWRRYRRWRHLAFMPIWELVTTP
jgi:FkbM family methyltransferase